MPRQVRSDCTLKTFAEKNNMPLEIFKNKNGRKTRCDKTIGAIRKEYKKK